MTDCAPRSERPARPADDRFAMQRLAAEIGRPLTFMEVCGTHTMAAFRSGLRALLPPGVRLLSGPGCPVCVTPNRLIDKAIAISRRPGVVLAAFGDMIRVPGSEDSLERARAEGADIRVVYSAADALDLARALPERSVVFLGIGFETTTPGTAWTVLEAARAGISNFSVLAMHKTIPEAMALLLEDGEVGIDGFLCPGHVSVIIGSRPYEFICRNYHIPCVVAGFEPADMLEAMRMLLEQVRAGRAEVEIQYRRCVHPEGNAAARAAVERVFEPCDAEWRGLGIIPASGLRIRPEFREFDAEFRFPDLELPPPREPAGCICGAVLKGVRTPPDCPLFARACTPTTPVGACMVSSEGACAAYYRFARDPYRG